MLYARHLDFAKIATAVSTLESGSLRLRTSEGTASGSRSGYYDDRIGAESVNNTLSKAREKHDVQPLSKDRRSVRKPMDRPFGRKMFKTQKRLGQLEDKRITHSHLKRSTRFPVFAGWASSLQNPLVASSY